MSLYVSSFHNGNLHFRIGVPSTPVASTLCEVYRRLSMRLTETCNFRIGVSPETTIVLLLDGWRFLFVKSFQTSNDVLSVRLCSVRARSDTRGGIRCLFLSGLLAAPIKVSRDACKRSTVFCVQCFKLSFLQAQIRLSVF